MTFNPSPQLAYGSVERTDDGSAIVQALGDQLHAWAHRPGAWWPCSALAGYDYVRAEFDPSGDLIALTIRRDGQDDPGDALMADELSAWADDVRELNA